MGNLKKRTIVIFVLLLIALYVVIEIVPSMVGALKGTEVIEYGNLRISNDVTCYFVRNETIYTAEQTSKVKYNVEEGTLVKRGSQVVNLEATGEADEAADSEYKEMLSRASDNVAMDKGGISQRKGVFSQTIDGYESYFSPTNMLKLKRDEVEALDLSPTDIRQETVRAGDPVYKITGNSIWYITFWVERGDIAQYENGKRVQVVLGDETVACKVANIIDHEDSWQIVLSTNRYYSDFTKVRSMEAEIVTTDVNGVLISNRCITTKDGQPGVFRKGTSGEYTFVPVRILATDGKVSAVSEGFYYDAEGQMVNTVEVYDEVRTNPGDEKEQGSEKRE